MKMAKTLMVIRPPFGLNNEYGRILKDITPLRSAAPCRPRKLHTIWWVVETLAVKPEIVGVAPWCQHAVGLFCLPQLQSKEGAFKLIPTKHLGTFESLQVGRSSTPCQKRSQVWGRESERWPKYMQQRLQCWKWAKFRETSSVL